MFQILSYACSLLLAVVLANVLKQLLPRQNSEPPVIFHWIPFIGNAITYGKDPIEFLAKCREKHGDIFTFQLLNRKMTCYLGLSGNSFILNGPHSHLNAEAIYSPLTTPVFGSDVVYDCPNAKLMEQKRFVKFGLTSSALAKHVRLIEGEVLSYLKTAEAFRGKKEGTVDITTAMAELTIYTVGSALQGEEVREKLTKEMAGLYHDLDMGFQPVNFVLPSWIPLPSNRRRDRAHAKMRGVYMDIINARRANFGAGKKKEGTQEEEKGNEVVEEEEPYDMLDNLMRFCTYKSTGLPIPDKEIAHMMITLLMGGQHSSSSASSWIMLHLASQPSFAEELYREQVTVLSVDAQGNLPPLQHAHLEKLPLLQATVKETLRCHASITSILRQVTRPMPVPNSPYIISPDKVLLASPAITSLDPAFFPDPHVWNPRRWLTSSSPPSTSPSSTSDKPLNQEDTVTDYSFDPTSKAASSSPYLPFGAGRHRCIGEKFAYVNLGVIVAVMVRELKIRTIGGGSDVPETDFSSLFAKPKSPAVVRWERRSQ